MSTITSPQSAVQDSEIAQARKDQPETNGLTTPQMSRDGQGVYLHLNDSSALSELLKAQAAAKAAKLNQPKAVMMEALDLMALVWEEAFRLGQNHGLKTAFQDAFAEAPTNPFKEN